MSEAEATNRALAVDIGGSHASCAAVDECKVLMRRSAGISDARSFAALLPEIARQLRSIVDQLTLETSDFLGLAISFPGIIDPFRCRVLSTPRDKFEDAAELDLTQWAQQEFGLPLAIENDARVALLGERSAGAGRTFSEIVMLTFGTGVGGAAMIEGRLLRGKHFQAGCLGGHIPAVFDGRACICGNTGCVEAEASTWALPEICRNWTGFEGSLLASEPVLNFEALFRCSAQADRIAVAIRDRCLRVWASGVVGLIHAYDPEVVVLGGAVMASGEQIVPFIQDHVNRHAWARWGRVVVKAAELGSDAALMGAVPLLVASAGEREWRIQR